MKKGELEALANKISECIVKSQKEILNTEEAAAYLGISSSTMYKLTHMKQIKYSKPHGKLCFFKRSDLDAWMLSNPVATESEINTCVVEYVASNPIPTRRSNRGSRHACS